MNVATDALRPSQGAMELARRFDRSYEVHPNAHHAWEMHDTPFLLMDVIDELLSLPPEERVDSEVIVPVVIRNKLEGKAFGRRFRLIGKKSSADEWRIIFEVQPL